MTVLSPVADLTIRAYNDKTSSAPAGSRAVHFCYDGSSPDAPTALAELRRRLAIDFGHRGDEFVVHLRPEVRQIWSFLNALSTWAIAHPRYRLALTQGSAKHKITGLSRDEYASTTLRLMMLDGADTLTLSVTDADTTHPSCEATFGIP